MTMENPQIILVITGVIVLVGLILILSGWDPRSKKMDKRIAKDNEIIKNKHDVLINDMKSKYGDITKEIYFGSIIDQLSRGKYWNYIFIFEKIKIIVISGTPYNFKDIIGYKLSDNNDIIAMSSVQKSSTGSVIGRTIVGGVLGGGIGAVIGGTTATKNTITTSNALHSYTFSIILNSLSNPNLEINLKDLKIVNEINALLSVIIERNRSIQQ